MEVTETAAPYKTLNVHPKEKVVDKIVGQWSYCSILCKNGSTYDVTQFNVCPRWRFSNDGYMGDFGIQKWKVTGLDPNKKLIIGNDECEMSYTPESDFNELTLIHAKTKCQYTLSRQQTALRLFRLHNFAVKK